MFITHPLGASFVAKLQEQDPSTVPHGLPLSKDFAALAEGQGQLVAALFEETVVGEWTTYVAGARKDLRCADADAG